MEDVIAVVMDSLPDIALIEILITCLHLLAVRGTATIEQRLALDELCREVRHRDVRAA